MDSSCELFIPSFMKTGKSFQTILRFCLRNVIGFSVGITDGRVLCIMTLRWVQVP
jgi:hypothetical protein